MSAPTGHRWRLWLVLLVVAAGITVTLAMMLGGKPDDSGVETTQHPSDGTDSSLRLGSGRSVPKLLLHREPVERVASPVPTEQIAGKESAPTVTAQAQTKDQQSAPDAQAPSNTQAASNAQAPSNIIPGLAQRLRDITERLKRLKTATGSGGSGP